MLQWFTTTWINVCFSADRTGRKHFRALSNMKVDSKLGINVDVDDNALR